MLMYQGLTSFLSIKQYLDTYIYLFDFLTIYLKGSLKDEPLISNVPIETVLYIDALLDLCLT